LTSKGYASRLKIWFSLFYLPFFAQAVLHQEFVGPKADKLLGLRENEGQRELTRDEYDDVSPRLGG